MTQENLAGESPGKEGTPSQEGLETQNKEVEQLRSDLQKMEQNLKSAQGVTKKQAQDLEQLHAQYDAAVSSRDTYQALIGWMSQQTGRSEEEIETEVQTKKPDFIKQTQTIMAQQEQRQQQRRFVEKINSYQALVERELGLKEGDEDYDSIQGLVLAGKWDKVDKRIEAIKAKQAEKTEPLKVPEKKETEEEQEARLEKKFMEKHGLLKTESGAPSAPGGKLTPEMVEKMSPDERWQRRDEIAKMPLGLGKEKIK